MLGKKSRYNLAKDPNAREVKISILFTRIGKLKNF